MNYFLLTRLSIVFGAICTVAAHMAPISAAEKNASELITFNKHIAPLVFDRCAGCHRPGEVAPFSLLSYKDVSKRAEQIAAVTEQRIMPPWRPVAGHGEFANGRRLSDTELGLIRQWVAGGVVEGAAADLPKPPQFADGWQLGEPDLIVTMPTPYQVPAEGRDIYQNFVLPFKVPAGKYLKAAEFRPSNRRIVHHAVLFIDTSGKARKQDEADTDYGFRAITPPGRNLPGTMAIWTPGRFPRPLPEGLSMPWPAEADLVANIHLHPSGKPEEEQSSIGFHFTDEAPRRSLLDVTLIDTKIDIPPGERTFRTHDSCTLPIDMEALSIFPHMHMIGKEIKVTATLPDGKVQPLLWIDDWNFNWQDLYEYSDPVRLPQGTKITLEGTHDNSADNPHNPKNPPERVKWGEQTFNEMSIAFLNLMPAKEADVAELSSRSDKHVRVSIVPASTRTTLAASGKSAPTEGAPTSKPPAPAELEKFASDALKKADKDGNGKLSLDEIVAAINKRQTPEEIDKQITRFDRDGDHELNLAEVTEAIKALAKR